MDNPLVSVIIPTKNEGKIIEACLCSLREQTTKHDFEIIMVDTNSRDNTLELAEKYGAKIVKENRPGKNKAREAGSNHATGEILCFTEADCQVPATWIDTIVKTFESHREAAAVTGIYTFSNSTFGYRAMLGVTLPLSVVMFWLVHGHHSLRGTNFAIRRKHLKQAGGFDPQIMDFDDVELSMRAQEVGKILFVPAMKVKTLDRRVRGRLLKFLQEYWVTYYKACIKREKMPYPMYDDIR